MTDLARNLKNAVLDADDIAELTAWRRELHRHPELSGEEQATAARIVDNNGGCPGGFDRTPRDHQCSTLCQGVGCKDGSIGFRTGHGNEDHPRPHETRIGGHAGNLDRRRRQTVEWQEAGKFVELHLSPIDAMERRTLMPRAPRESVIV